MFTVCCELYFMESPLMWKNWACIVVSIRPCFVDCAFYALLSLVEAETHSMCYIFKRLPEDVHCMISNSMAIVWNKVDTLTLSCFMPKIHWKYVPCSCHSTVHYESLLCFLATKTECVCYP